MLRTKNYINLLRSNYENDRSCYIDINLMIHMKDGAGWKHERFKRQIYCTTSDYVTSINTCEKNMDDIDFPLMLRWK
jgi:hypothetical protein